KPLLEWGSSAQPLNHLIEPLKHAGLCEHFTVEIVLLMPELQQVSERILKCANPDLKRAAITDEGADVKRDSVLGCAHAFVRRADLLGQHIDTSVQQIAHHVCVVAADVTLLREGTVE